MIADIVPETPEEAAAAIREAALSGTPLTLRGACTRTQWGAGARVISSAALSGILSYNPAEMVMTALSGTPLAAVEAALSENSQMLAFEPMDHRPLLGMAGEPTIGGVFAVNASGPRRLVAGAARDSLLGLSFVNGRGEIIRAGGRVMKNVTGLDLVKLLAGSRGSLGFITQVTFRVLPAPRATETVVISGLDDAHATAAMATALSLPVDVSAAAHLPFIVSGRFLGRALPEGSATLLRLEGHAASVQARRRKLMEALGAFGPASVLEEAESRALWRQVRDAEPYGVARGKVVWRISVAPTAGHQLMNALRLHAGVDCFYDWQGGLIWAQMEADPEADFLRGAIRHLGGGHATLTRAPAHVWRAVPVEEPQPPALAALSARVRQALDPLGLFQSSPAE